MRNNKATWIFLALLLLVFVWRFYSFGKELHFGPVTFLVAFIMALYTTIAIFDWVDRRPNESWIFKVPLVRNLKMGAHVGFWPRQAIFFGGFLIGYLLLKLG